METQQATTGSIRKDIYAYVAQVIGRDLTEPEHKALRAQIMEHSRLLVPITSQKKIRREWTCRECRRVDVLSKNGDKKRRHESKGETKVVTEPEAPAV